jgi:hypothetical protein
MLSSINFTNIGNGSWNINLSGGTFNNLGITSNANFGSADNPYLQTSGSDGYNLQLTQASPLVSGAIFTIAAVPEPSTWAMMILGFLGVGFMAYRKKATLRFA